MTSEVAFLQNTHGAATSVAERSGGDCINAIEIASPRRCGAATLVAERNMESHINATKVVSPQNTHGAATLVAEKYSLSHANATKVASPGETHHMEQRLKSLKKVS